MDAVALAAGIIIQDGEVVVVGLSSPRKLRRGVWRWDDEADQWFRAWQPLLEKEHR